MSTVMKVPNDQRIMKVPNDQRNARQLKSAQSRSLAAQRAVAGGGAWSAKRRLGYFLLSVLFLLVAWWIASTQFSAILLPGPVPTGKALITTLSNASVLKDLWVSFEDLVLGLAASLVIGILAGVMIGRYQKVEAILDPYVNFMNATPTVALVPLVIVWFGVATEARVVFIILISIWSILVNTIEGVRSTQKGYVEVGQSFELSEWETLRLIVLPAASPYIFAGIRIAIGRAFVGVIVGEMEMQYAGIGGLLATLGGNFQTASLLAMVFVTSVFGAAIIIGFTAWQRRRVPWIEEIAGARR